MFHEISLCEENIKFTNLAVALAIIVLPQPGGPCNKTPLGADIKLDLANSSLFCIGTITAFLSSPCKYDFFNKELYNLMFLTNRIGSTFLYQRHFYIFSS